MTLTTTKPESAHQEQELPQETTQEPSLRDRTIAYFQETGRLISDPMPEMRIRWTLPGTDEHMPVAEAARISMIVAGRLGEEALRELTEHRQ